MKQVYESISLKGFLCLVVITLSLVGCSQDNGSDRESNLLQAEAYTDVAQIYLSQGQYRSAYVELQNALQLVPDYEYALATLAEANMEVGDIFAAIDILTPLQSRTPDDTEVSLLLGEAFVSANQPQQAINLLTTLDMQDSSARNTRNWILGTAHTQLGNTNAANQSFQLVLRDDPQHIPSLIGLSLLSYLNGDLEQARQFMETAEASSPNDLDLLIWQGSYALLNGQYPEAEEAYTDALEIMSSWDMITARRYSAIQDIQTALQMQQKDAQAMQYAQILAETPQGQLQSSLNTAMSLFQQGDFSNAREALMPGLEVAPGNPQSNVLLGMTDFALGDYEAAAETLSTFIDMESASPQAIRTLAATHLQLNDPEAALAVLSQARARFPDDIALLALTGAAQRLMGDFEESIETLIRALVLEPESAELNVEIADAYSSSGSNQQAEESLTRAMEIDPGFIAARVRLIDLYLTRMDYDSATRMVNQWLSEEPDSIDAHTVAGNVALAAGDTSTARSHYQTVLQASPENTEIRYRLIQAAVSDEDFQEAQSQVEIMIGRDPTSITTLNTVLSLGSVAGTEDQALAQVEQLLGDYPAAYTPAIALAQYHLNEGNLASAREYAELAISREENATTTSMLTNTLLEQINEARQVQNLDQASQLVERSMEISGSDLRVLFAAAFVANDQGNSELAQDYVDQVRLLYPDSAASYELAGDLFIANGDSNGAINIYQEGWSQNRRTASIAAKLQSTLTIAGRTEEAATFLGDWLAEFPQNGAANLLRALEYQQQGVNTEAIGYYEVALNALPDNVTALNNLAWLLQENEPERALDLAARAAEISPNDADVLDTYGWILFNQGNQEQAAAILRRAQELAPESEEIAEHLEAATQ